MTHFSPMTARSPIRRSSAPEPGGRVRLRLINGASSTQFWIDLGTLAGTVVAVDGQRVALEMVNHTMMAHPMHLHGHAFQVVAINGAQLAGAVRDTVLVPPMGSITIAFDADNPGRWAFHCHNLYHMTTGMMTEVRYPAII